MGMYGREDRFSQSWIKKFCERIDPGGDKDPNDPITRRRWVAQDAFRGINNSEDDIYVLLVQIDRGLSDMKAHLDQNLRLERPYLGDGPDKLTAAVARRQFWWDVLTMLLNDAELAEVMAKASPPGTEVLASNIATRRM
jgi:hypothetical protein